MNKKLLHLFFLLSALTPLLLAQNNPYKIKDGLYAYYQQCVKNINSPRVLLMADTLFTCAGREGDQKAQCLAMNLKCDYYYYKRDIRALMQANERLQKFAERTPHQQYIFGCWGRLITLYTKEKDFDAALAECNAYQQKAIQLNNAYGIGSSYRMLGNVYYTKQDKEAALAQFRKTVKYYVENNENRQLPDVYAAMSQCFHLSQQDDSALYYGYKALKGTTRIIAKIPIYENLVTSHLSLNEPDKAKAYLDSLDTIRKDHPFVGSNLQNYLTAAASYYISIGEFDRSRALIDSLTDSLVLYSYKRDMYAAKKRFDSAYIWFNAAYLYERAQYRKANAKIMAEYAARFDNERLELEKNRLSLQNAEINLQRLANEHKLVLAGHERDSLQLTTTDLKLQNSELALVNQQMETEHNRAEAESLKERAIDAEQRNRLQSIIISVTGLLLLFCIYHIYMRRQNYRHLQWEKEAADAAREEAEQARQKAENADKLKSLFLQNVSHEIRTPLNAIVGFTGVLNSGEDMGLSEEERKEMLELIETNTELLTTLVNDILDLSKLESDTYILCPSSVRVSELCRNTLQSIKERVPAGVKLLLEEPEYAADIVFTTDAARLQQVLTNFLTNACKYTGQGSITLAYKVIEENGGIQFSVTDTGCGIPPEKAEQVFTRFEKLDSFKQGTGIGLNICRRIADLVGGKVFVDTTYTGGARFVFIHPTLKMTKAGV